MGLSSFINDIKKSVSDVVKTVENNVEKSIIP